MLGWGLFVDKAYRHDRNRVKLPKFLDRGPEVRIQEAIENDAFKYIRVLLVPSLDVPQSGWGKVKKDERDRGVPLGMTDTWPEVEGEYQRDALRQIDSLVKDMIGSFQLIKKLKNREEDKVKALDMTRNGDEDGAKGEVDTEVRQDFNELVELVITVYRELPLDHDDKLWVDSKFINLVGDAEGAGNRALLCRLLIAISSGSAGSYWLYSHLVKESSDLNLDGIHEHFEYVAKNKVPVARLASTAAAVSKGMEVNLLADPELAPDDARCLAYYCEMLALIVKWHPHVAGEMNANWKTVKRLWDIISRNVPVELAAAALAALSAFGSLEVTSVSPGLAETSLSALDTLNVLPRNKRAEATRPATGFAMSTDEANAAWLTSLEDHDMVAGVSANRIALVRLFSVLIAVSDPEDGYLNLTDVNQTTTVRRIRSKMTEYILDDVFAACISMIQEGNSAAGYPLLEAILQFVAKTMAGLDLDALLEPARVATPINQTESDRLVSLQQHPGFLALRRVIGNETLREAVFTAARIRVAEGLPESVPSSLFAKISFRAIQVLRTVMARQAMFLEVIVPSLRRRYSAQDLQWASGNLYPVDWHLAHQPQTITQIASYVSVDVSDGLAAETISFLRDLGRSPHMRVPFLSGGKTIQGNILAYVFRDAPNSNVVLAGFVDRLERGQNEATVEIDILPSRLVAAYDKDIEARVPKRTQQNQIVDLLLENTLPERSEITFAHFLLGFLDAGANARGLVKTLLRDGVQAGTIIADGKVTEVEQMIPRTCFHVIVDRLSKALPALDAGAQEDVPISIVADSAELGYKCIKLLRQLVESDTTAQVTARYLRSQEDLVHRSLVYLPVVPEISSDAEQALVTYGNGSSLECTAADMVYLLAYQAQVLDLASLELHMLEPTASEAVNIIQSLLHGTSAAFQPLRGVLAMTVLAGLDFRWEANTAEANAAGFERINFNAFRGVDAEGASVFAIPRVESAIRSEIERLERKAPSPERTATLEQNKHDVLAYLQRQNGVARVANAVRLALQAWATAVTAVLTKETTDEALVIGPATTFELSTAAFTALLSPTMQIPEKAETLASVLLSISGLLARPADSGNGKQRGGPPVDRLQTLLGFVCQAIADSEISELARGLLYATLTNYLELVRRYAEESGAAKSAVEIWMAAVLQPVYFDLERLLGIIGRDALNGSADWQLVSYTLLDELLTVFEDKMDIIVTSLGKRGLLHNFLAAIRVADASIQGVFSAEAGE
jgi:nuclear pore complex protein Nup205